MVWYSHLLKNFIVIHTVKGFGIVNKAEIYVFLELSCFFNDPVNVGNLISGSSWKILSITLLACAAAAAKSLQSCPTLCDPTDSSPLDSPVWDSPRKNTGVGCHFRLQCMRVKSEREVAQSRPTLRDPMDCSLPGSSAHGIFQARVLEWGATLPSPI